MYDIDRDLVLAAHQVRKYPGYDDEKKQLNGRVKKVANGDENNLVEEDLCMSDNDPELILTGDIGREEDRRSVF